MMKNKLNFKLLNLLILMVILYIFIKTSGYWSGILVKVWNISLPFLLAFVFAYILHPFVKKLEEKGVRKNLATVIILAVFFFLVIGIIWLTLPVIYEQLVLFSKSIVQVITDLSSKYDLNLGEYQKTITDMLNELIKDIGSYLSSGTISFVNTSIKVLTNAIIVVIVGIYFLTDMDHIRKSIKMFFKRCSKQSYNLVKRMDHEIGNYFHGLAIFMVVQFIEYSFLFWIIGHPNWLLLGTLACITTVIPYFGGLITNIIAVITASVISTPLFIFTLVITLIFPNIDGYVISPRIYGKTNNINPVVVIFIAAAFSSIFGIVGIAIALPSYILMRCFFDAYWDDIKEKIEEVKDNSI